MFATVIVVVASDERPFTVRVPFEVNDDVAVIDPPVILPLVSVEKKAVTPLRSEVKRLEEVALVLVRLVIIPLLAKRLVVVLFVVVELVTVSPVMLARVATRLEKKPLVVVLLVKLALVEERLVLVLLVITLFTPPIFVE
jgi:hypothetical protein